MDQTKLNYALQGSKLNIVLTDDNLCLNSNKGPLCSVYGCTKRTDPFTLWEPTSERILPPEAFYYVCGKHDRKKLTEKNMKQYQIIEAVVVKRRAELGPCSGTCWTLDYGTKQSSQEETQKNPAWTWVEKQSSQKESQESSGLHRVASQKEDVYIRTRICGCRLYPCSICARNVPKLYLNAQNRCPCCQLLSLV